SVISSASVARAEDQRHRRCDREDNTADTVTDCPTYTQRSPAANQQFREFCVYPPDPSRYRSRETARPAGDRASARRYAAVGRASGGASPAGHTCFRSGETSSGFNSGGRVMRGGKLWISGSILCLVIASLAGSRLEARDWPRFRGPIGTGVRDQPVSAEWGPEKNM